MSDFKFKNFAISQDRTAMKVGTDGVLLGSWVRLMGTEQNILDIGTGTGLIAIMMAQRSAASNIVGVEIDPSSAQQASENMGASPWADRLSTQLTPIQNYTPQQKFDLILSNPPYFIDSLLAKGKSRTTARHTTELSFDDLVVAVKRVLTPNGRFVVILPTVESQRFEQLAEGSLCPIRRCFVRGKVNGDIKRVMSEYTLAGDSRMAQISEQYIAVRDTPPGDYTAEYKTLTSDFYLKF